LFGGAGEFEVTEEYIYYGRDSNNHVRIMYEYKVRETDSEGQVVEGVTPSSIVAYQVGERYNVMYYKGNRGKYVVNFSKNIFVISALLGLFIIVGIALLGFTIRYYVKSRKRKR
jgi:hypothetical protein